MGAEEDSPFVLYTHRTEGMRGSMVNKMTWLGMEIEENLPLGGQLCCLDSQVRAPRQ